MLTYNTQKGTIVTDYSDVITGYDDSGDPIYQHEAIGTHVEFAVTTSSQDLWFAYDNMNRQILVDGAVDATTRRFSLLLDRT